LLAVPHDTPLAALENETQNMPFLKRLRFYDNQTAMRRRVLKTLNRGVFKTDQSRCYDERGAVIPCEDTGHDGDFQAGVAWPEPRFVSHDETVIDRLTGLMWTRNANLAEFPLMWEEALGYVGEMSASEMYGFADWRLPNRRELFSLVSHVQTNPSLAAGHPFMNVFTGYYWTSTTCARLPSQAWYVHFGGGRVFKGMKHGSYMVWPVRGGSNGLIELAWSGQRACFSESGEIIPCAGSGQDAAFRAGAAWPEPRLIDDGDMVIDRLTGLAWAKNANFTAKPVSWQTALDAVETMNTRRAYGHEDWRLPNIRELESLVNAGSHTPALPTSSPFKEVREYYWSSTTSTYDPRYAWVLYMVDGAVGVGHKVNPDFFLWAVRGGQPSVKRATKETIR
jgi:hypothetical protein